MNLLGAINNIDVEITKKPFLLDCDENDDADSTTQLITHSTNSEQSKKHLIKQEHDTSSSSKKPKLNELKGKEIGKKSDVDKLVSSLHVGTSNLQKSLIILMLILALWLVRGLKPRKERKKWMKK